MGWQRAERHYVGHAYPYREYVYDGLGNNIGEHKRDAWYYRSFPLGFTPLAKHAGATTLYVHGDVLKSTQYLTNRVGDVSEKRLYYAFGQSWRSAGSGYEVRFAGLGWRDAESQLDPTPARMYESRLYRWLTPDEFTGGPVSAYGPPDPTPPGPLPYADILNPQSLNKYQYAYNNPTRYIDPNGHLPVSFWVKTLPFILRLLPPPPPPSIVKPPPKPPKEAFESLVKYHGHKVSDARVREGLGASGWFLGARIDVTSGDRTKVVKGSFKHSAHKTKEAADFHARGTPDSEREVDPEVKTIFRRP